MIWLPEGRLPEIQLVDEGYMEIDLLLDSKNKGIDLVRPVPSSKSWQDRMEGAFNHTQFQIDWDKRIVTCPNHKTSARCSERKTWRGTPSFTFVFDKEDCLPCLLRVHCSRAKNVGRTLTLYPKEQYEAQLAARQRQQTPEFKKLYGERAGIESTMSQGVRRTRMRYARYIGLVRTHLQQISVSSSHKSGSIIQLVDRRTAQRNSNFAFSDFCRSNMTSPTNSYRFCKI